MANSDGSRPIPAGGDEIGELLRELREWPGDGHGLRTRAATALEQLQRERDAALGYATRFLVSFVNEHCDPVPEWKPLPDLLGVLTQLDNATTIARTLRARVSALEARAAASVEQEREACAKIAERDVDWTLFARQPKKDWRTGAETNVFAPMDDPDETFPSPVAVFAYANGIAAGRAIAAAIRSRSSNGGQR